jgi:hypothetical protein
MAEPPTTITSAFALLDVKKGRRELLKYLGYEPSGKRVSVTITCCISHAWGSDDGTSIEFAVDVGEVVRDPVIGHWERKMTRQQRIEQVAMVIFRHRGGRLIPGDELSPLTVEAQDMREAERFIDMLDAQHSSGAQ